MARYLNTGDEVYVAQDDLFDKTLVGTLGKIIKINGSTATIAVTGSSCNKQLGVPLSDLEKLEFHPTLSRR